ncbi:cobyrinate a,c-diamide synthase [Rhodoblastus acidophilus]|uniref:Cobyrinate a,c-diamide synthase n=1 Tax=Candidatus Rhodoblastus alkanivorans TaxID=2954117 RepID=A0ABS9Z8J6_9HYPH|nr:cobyrinate a,c-diamide synthase [Candidatus Rhodoblastus alkanivorans]MCI4680337.1 cobyrinate a,c-diamide synthase [Candidatus Rhodoblastus alkanivorans]MCI4684010.1 cobyrinate a,c-diamide synthase [Candidatus Rhodoblastus alkanivorans]MDI4641329.1 cobyrinate a,c-diamide synthase [Rhodoblastus acidophilus]
MTRFYVSAAIKSSGKTTISIGLAAALASRGLKVQTYKKGPDYIDPMWLARASGRASFNLDFNTQSPDEIAGLYRRAFGDADLALIEGNKGLHDGVDPHGADSSAALAKLLRAPVVLVIDAHGMARGIAPLLLGYRNFDPGVEFAGVILNKVGDSRQEGKLRQAIENYTDLKVLGAIGRDRGLNIDERHLGLTTPDETGECDDVIAHAREAVLKGVDLDALLRATEREETRSAPALRALPAPDVTIAVARDAAFGFYYADDLLALQEAGARLVFVDTLRDRALPACDGFFIGGGFPETQSQALSANRPLRENIKAAIEGGMPTYAECGGMMYLTRSILYRGAVEEMVGVIPADSVMGDRPQGRGLVRVEETADFPWPGEKGVGAASVAAHEFHYARLENVAPDLRYAWRVKRGYGVDGQRDGIVIGNLFASFTHQRDTSRHRWTDRFVAFVRMQKRKRLGVGSGGTPAGKNLAGRRRAV